MHEPNDILEPLPFDEWTHLKENLNRDWPHFAFLYYWVDNAIKWKTKEPSIETNIYCPEGKVDSGVFIGIESYSYYMVIPFAFPESKPLLRDCIVKTKVIDWREGVLFGDVHEYSDSVVREAIKCLEKSVQLKLIDQDGYCNYYFKSREDCLAVEVKVPEDMELKFLQESDVPFIYDLWSGKEEENPEKPLKFVATLIRLNKGIGLFKKADNKLVSWVLQNNCGGLAVLQTLDEHQGKGYGKIVVNAMSKHLATEGLDVTSFVLKSNTPSVKLFTSLNFKPINDETYIVMKAFKKN